MTTIDEWNTFPFVHSSPCHLIPSMLSGAIKRGIFSNGRWHVSPKSFNRRLQIQLVFSSQKNLKQNYHSLTVTSHILHCVRKIWNSDTKLSLLHCNTPRFFRKLGRWQGAAVFIGNNRYRPWRLNDDLMMTICFYQLTLHFYQLTFHRSHQWTLINWELWFSENNEEWCRQIMYSHTCTIELFILLEVVLKSISNY